MKHARLEPKRRGELAELAFLYKASSLGLVVSKPYGDSARYDFLVDDGERIWKVQVKSAEAEFQGAYYFNSHRSANGQAISYTERDIDLLVGYVPKYEAWYVIPVEAFGAIKSIRVYPHRKPAREKYERYRDGWAVFGRRLTSDV